MNRFLVANDAAAQPTRAKPSDANEHEIADVLEAWLRNSQSRDIRKLLQPITQNVSHTTHGSFQLYIYLKASPLPPAPSGCWLVAWLVA